MLENIMAILEIGLHGNPWGLFFMLFCLSIPLIIGIGGFVVSLYVERHNKRVRRTRRKRDMQ